MAGGRSVGRKDAITALARFLIRTSKRNVIVIGDAGVGKSAIVEGLAAYAASEQAPNFLRPLRFLQINVADLIAGTKYRGDAEARVQAVMREAAADSDLVLFFDEIHLVVGAGATKESGMDIANILKPALTGDVIRCIGATTTAEFDKYISRDTAFMRRFQVLKLAEPSEPEAIQICQEWAERISGIQDVTITHEAVAVAVRLSSRFVRNRSLPDKAIDLIENAAAMVKLSSLSATPHNLSKAVPTVGIDEIEAVMLEQYGIDPRLIKEC